MLEAARSLITSARRVPSDVNFPENEVHQLSVLHKSLMQTINHLKEDDPVGSGLDKRRKALLDILDELRRSSGSMMSDKGDATVLEIQQLRTANSAFTIQVNQLQTQEQTLKSLLIITYQARTPATSSIAGMKTLNYVNMGKRKRHGAMTGPSQTS
ncbi:hypothetical protein EJ02DRAFT_248068 [Clathrospora elynae]|uniref:Uncharacterized protein n=1 Tax=Clathrospora elynae TaxID=706981 RepID=A0A6A5T654_9PLEO|nr:hypothetical protein EJ02DRAFT_248068 [Clathrospora elynae]